MSHLSAADRRGAGGRVVLIGLDSLDPGLARTWAAAGELPTLARLFGDAAQSPVTNPFGLFVGALWASFASALRPHRHGFHCWEEIDVASYRCRANAPEPDRYESFWKRIGDAGRRVAAVDVPHSRAPESLNGLEVAEWGCHDRHFGFHARPRERAGELEAGFGLHPVFGIDAYAAREFAPDDFAFRRGAFRTPDEDAALVDALVRGASAKGKLVSALLAEEEWDIFLAVFGEAHAIGHQQWHLHDPAHPRFDPAARDHVGGDPLLQVYRAVDTALGRVLAEVGPETAVFVLLSHGMTAHYDGTHLLGEVLARLDRPGPAGVARRALHPALSPLGALATAAGIPPAFRAGLGRAVRGDGPRALARRRFFAEPNNSVFGGVRLNLAGREPRGRVRPEDADRLCAALEKNLLAMINEDSGRPAVVAVTRANRDHERTPDDTMPDLFVHWDRSAPIETVSSPKIGTVRIPYTEWRTGDHLPEGLLLAAGPGIPGGRAFPAIAVEDFGPSIATRLGVPLADVDGAVIDWLARGAR